MKSKLMEIFKKVLSEQPLNDRINVVKKLINEAAINPAAESYKERENGELEQIGNKTYVWAENQGKWILAVFGPKKSWPDRYGYSSKSNLDAALERARSNASARSAEKIQRKNDSGQRKKMMGQLVYEGDIFYWSGGYDQTNVDFYEVTKKISNDTLEVRELNQKIVDSSGGGYQTVKAIAGSYAGPAKKVRVTSYGISLSAFGRSSDHARPWDGKPMYSTAAGFGH